MAFCDACDRLRRTVGNDLATARAPFGPNVNNPISGFNDVEVVFNHHDGIACIAQLREYLEQQLDVGKVQARGGLVQYINRASGVALR